MKAYLRYYAKEAYYLMGNGKEKKKKIYSIMFKQDCIRVCSDIFKILSIYSNSREYHKINKNLLIMNAPREETIKRR